MKSSETWNGIKKDVTDVLKEYKLASCRIPRLAIEEMDEFVQHDSYDLDILLQAYNTLNAIEEDYPEGKPATDMQICETTDEGVQSVKVARIRSCCKAIRGKLQKWHTKILEDPAEEFRKSMIRITVKHVQKKKMSVEEISEATFLPAKTIQELFTGKEMELSFADIRALCECAGISVMEIMAETTGMHFSPEPQERFRQEHAFWNLVKILYEIEDNTNDFLRKIRGENEGD